MWNNEVSHRHRVNGKYVLTTRAWSNWSTTICRIASKFGDILSANRRFSWIGDRIYSKHIRGFQMYVLMKDKLLGMPHMKVPYNWHNGEVYII